MKRKHYNIGKNNPNYGNPLNMKGKNHGRFKDGKYLKVYYCPDCLAKGIVTEITPDSERCYSCANKGKNNPMYGKKRDLNGKNNPMFGKIAKHGKGQYYKQSWMRSSWEILFAKYCIKNHIKYKYEPKAFEITYKYKGKKKEGTYRPDFYLSKQNLWIEIKGWWRDDAKSKFSAFKKQYPKIKIKIVDKKILKKEGIL